MTPRSLVVLLLLAATASASAQELSGRALQKFLGPVSPSLAKWQKNIMPDAESYSGTANPPLSGEIDISIYSERWNVAGCSDSIARSQFGVIPRFWDPDVSMSDGQFLGGGCFEDPKVGKVYLGIHSDRRPDVDTLAAELSRLPMFSSSTSTPFEGITLRRRIAAAIVWLLLPLTFLWINWSANHRLRKKGAGLSRQALVLTAISVAWIILNWFVWSRQPFEQDWPFWTARELVWAELTNTNAAGLDFGMAFAFFIAGVAIIACSLLHWLVRKLARA